MARAMRRRSVPPRGSCLAAVLLALAAALASPRRLVASGAEWHAVSVASLLPGAVCTAAEAASNSSDLRVVHRHGPCSPLQQSRGGSPPSHAEILARDQERVNSIHRKIKIAGDYYSKSKGGMSLPARWDWGTSLGINTYFVSVGLGTPARRFSVEFDTGSGMSWVQCEPCADCYEQQDPVFDPTKSSTFSAVLCGSDECQQFGSSLNNNCSSSGNNNSCRYEVIYGDDSQTDGDLARDTLTLAPSDVTVPGFVFGCGHTNTGVFGELDGLLGLDRYAASLPSQAAASLGGAVGFSYCLPSTSSSVGYLSLGLGRRRAAPANAQYTAMLTGKYRSFYYLDLVGVRVAGRPIRIAPAAFAAAAGTIIDSGTAFSRLPPRAYAALRSAFARAMGRYRYKRAPALPFLDTCYDLAGVTTVRVPAVALVFAGGATVALDRSGVLYTSENASQVCLAFAPNDDDTSTGIIGSMQQKTLAVVYDVANQKIGFGPKGCA